MKANSIKMIAFFLAFLFINEGIFSQTPLVNKDSTEIYQTIETYSKRSRFTKFVYQLVFKPDSIVSPKKKAVKSTYNKIIKKTYGLYEGKIIRNINIVTLDPFGFSDSDTSATPHNVALKAANKFHIKSHRITIQNLILIRENEPFDSLLVKESERLIRSQTYVRDVSFFIKLASKNSDSVDITIRELDIWCKKPDGSISNSSVSLSLIDKNFLGLGHGWQNGFSRYSSSGDYSYNTHYFIPNIRNTYINSNIRYKLDEFRNYNKTVAVDRPFFSAYAKWAAGISITQQFHKDSALLIDSSNIQRQFKINTQDYWAGYAFQLFKGNMGKLRSTNLIVAVRYRHINYLEKPYEEIGVQQVYSNEKTYLTSIGISTRKYVQDKSIFKFGVTEDVPIGQVYSITIGVQNKYNTRRMYLGGRISMGHYYHWGYLSSNFEYGSFIRASHIEQGVATAGINYFTGLYEIGRWKIRQFIKPRASIGLNRFNSDSLTLNNEVGLDGFQSAALSGNSRLVLTLQTQSYSPWNLIGFRFGPYITYSCGMLSNKDSGFKKSKLYSQIGLGVLIKNENLVFSSFQISIAFYPFIPGDGYNVFKTNSFRTTDFGFRDFEVGKPAIVVYR